MANVSSSRSTDNPSLKIFLVLVILKVKMSDLMMMMLWAFDKSKDFAVVDNEEEEWTR